MTTESEVRFSAAEIAQFERDLAHLDYELRSIAREYGCKYYNAAGRGWPGRRVRRRLGLRTYEIRLILNPNYLHDQQVFYELREQWMYDFGELLTKLLSHHELAVFTSEDLVDIVRARQLIVMHLEKAMTTR